MNINLVFYTKIENLCCFAQLKDSEKMINDNKNNNRDFPSNFIKHRFGELDMIVISDGEVQYENSCFAPGIPKTILEETLRNYGPITAHFKLPHNILVIRFKENVIMIDTGNGYKESPHAGRLLDNLALAGIALVDITDIVLTHAHPDHTNGLIDEKNHLVFPKAKIHISKKEFEFWQGEADFSKSKNTIESLLALQKEIQFFFSIVENQLQFFTGKDLLFECLQPIPTPGHTPGHCIFTITSDNEKFTHLADIFHDEIMLFTQPEWGTIFDIDFELAGFIRRKVLEDFARSGQRVFGYHLPWPGFGHIYKEKGSFKWDSKI
jgi:glyoxylase-like metal-dependent hydrolase (beta-lactamase superfamily II)